MGKKRRITPFPKVDNGIRRVWKFTKDHLKSPARIALLAGLIAFLILWWWEHWLHGESGSTTVRNLSLIAVAIIALSLAIWRSDLFKKTRVPLLWSVYVFIISVGAVCLAYLYWECLLGNAGLARNFIFVVAALIGLPLAIWRSFVADRQSKTAQQQSETAQRDLLNERYQKGADMLGSKVLSVRLGGIYALERLAKEHAENYHVQIVKHFCAVVRNPPKDENAKDKNDNDAKSDAPQEKIREDV